MNTTPNPLGKIVDPARHDPQGQKQLYEECIQTLDCLLNIAVAAKAWWETRRPEEWTEEQHLHTPTVHRGPISKADADLAKAVAAWIKIGG